MSNDKFNAAYHLGQPLPRREPMEALMGWGQPPVSPARPPVDSEQAYASPGRPPWAPPQKRRTRGWVRLLIVLAVVFALCAIAVNIINLGKRLGNDPAPGPAASTAATDRTTRPTTPAAEDSPEQYKIGKAFRSGDFEYTIHGVKTGLTSVGDEYLRERAQGRFTRLDVTIKNVHDEPHFFDTDIRMKLEDETGRRFSASSSANVTGNPNAQGWFTEINPGNSIRAFAFFDLPKDVKAVRVVVSSGLFDFEEDAVVPLPGR